jgi:hypothetical protein
MTIELLLIGVAVWIGVCLLVVSLCAASATAERQQIGEIAPIAQAPSRSAAGTPGGHAAAHA